MTIYVIYSSDDDYAPIGYVTEDRYEEAEEAIESIGGYIEEVTPIVARMKPRIPGEEAFSFIARLDGSINISYLPDYETIFDDYINEFSDFMAGKVNARGIDQAESKARAMINTRASTWFPCTMFDKGD